MDDEIRVSFFEEVDNVTGLMKNMIKIEMEADIPPVPSSTGKMNMFCCSYGWKKTNYTNADGKTAIINLTCGVSAK